MRLKAHHYYCMQEPHHLPRKVHFLAYKGGGKCLVVDYASPTDSVYRLVSSKWLVEEWKPWFARWQAEHTEKQTLLAI